MKDRSFWRSGAAGRIIYGCLILFFLFLGNMVIYFPGCGGSGVTKPSGDHVQRDALFSQESYMGVTQRMRVRSKLVNDISVVSLLVNGSCPGIEERFRADSKCHDVERSPLPVLVQQVSKLRLDVDVPN